MEVMICGPFRRSPLSLLSSSYHPSSIPSSSSRLQLSSSSSSSSSSRYFQLSCSLMETHNKGRAKLLEFPFVSAATKNLMVDLVSTLENRLQAHLLPCSLPLDVQHHQSRNGAAQISLHIRPGHTNSPVDFVWGTWVHSEHPTGRGSLDMTTLSAYLNSSNDSPHFVFELIRHSPTMLVFILDLCPRKDLVLWPDDLKTFYEDTKLDTHRQALERVPEVQLYISPSLFIRPVTSPTAIMVRIQTENGGAERMEEIIRNHLDPISKQVLEIWLDHCACAKREVGEEERAYLKKRDGIIRNMFMEVDIGLTLLSLFGPEAGNKIVEAIKEYFIV